MITKFFLSFLVYVAILAAQMILYENDIDSTSSSVKHREPHHQSHLRRAHSTSEGQDTTADLSDRGDIIGQPATMSVDALSDPIQEDRAMKGISRLVQTLKTKRKKRTVNLDPASTAYSEDMHQNDMIRETYTKT
jgi:hypothetical protein